MFLSDNQIQSALAANGSPDGRHGAAVVGGSGRTLARFYMHAQLDGDATREAGRNIYREAEFVMLWAEGSKDSASHAATQQDKDDFPREWAEFQAQKSNPIHPVQYLPGFSASHRRYCEEARLFTVEALVAAKVQPELEGLQDTARRWLALTGVEAAPKRGGRKPGSKNKSKAAPHVEDA